MTSVLVVVRFIVPGLVLVSFDPHHGIRAIYACLPVCLLWANAASVEVSLRGGKVRCPAKSYHD